MATPLNNVSKPLEENHGFKPQHEQNEELSSWTALPQEDADTAGNGNQPLLTFRHYNPHTPHRTMPSANIPPRGYFVFDSQIPNADQPSHVPATVLRSLHPASSAGPSRHMHHNGAPEVVGISASHVRSATRPTALLASATQSSPFSSNREQRLQSIIVGPRRHAENSPPRTPLAERAPQFHGSSDLVTAINNALQRNGPPQLVERHEVPVTPERPRAVSVDTEFVNIAQGLSAQSRVRTTNPNIPRPPRLTNNSIVAALSAVFEQNAHAANEEHRTHDEAERSRPAGGTKRRRSDSPQDRDEEYGSERTGMARATRARNGYMRDDWGGVDRALGMRALPMSFDRTLAGDSPGALDATLSGRAMAGLAAAADTHAHAGDERPAHAWSGRTTPRWSDAGSYKVRLDELFGPGSMLRGFGKRPEEQAQAVMPTPNEETASQASLSTAIVDIEGDEEIEAARIKEARQRVMTRSLQIESPVRSRA